ncbi:MAG: helix-turn-helix domain-containing protein [Elainellaceae cyanobacterium]
MFLLPEGVPSEFAWTGEDEAIVFGISSASLRRTAEQADVNPDKVELKPVAIAYDKQITRYAHCLLHEIRTGGLGSKLYSESILTCLNIHLLRYYCAFKGKVKSDTGGLAPYKLKEILAYIKTNLADGDLSLGAMADLAQLSSYYFSRQFKQSTGYAPHKYVMQQRIEKAKRLLKQRQLPLMQVAFECGFSNQSHFGKVFKQATGTTPRRYREGL